MDVSDADGKHLHSHVPQNGGCLLHIILRITVRDQYEILGDTFSLATPMFCCKIFAYRFQGQSDFGAATCLRQIPDVAIDALAGVELIEEELVLEAVTKLSKSNPHKVFGHGEAIDKVNGEIFHGHVVIRVHFANAARLIEEEDQVGPLLFTNCNNERKPSASLLTSLSVHYLWV